MFILPCCTVHMYNEQCSSQPFAVAGGTILSVGSFCSARVCMMAEEDVDSRNVLSDCREDPPPAIRQYADMGEYGWKVAYSRLQEYHSRLVTFWKQFEERTVAVCDDQRWCNRQNVEVASKQDRWNKMLVQMLKDHDDELKLFQDLTHRKTT